MKILRDFACAKCGDTNERFIDADVRSVPCECGGSMQRVMGMPHVTLEGITGDFPGAADRWARVREEKAAIHKRKSYYEG